MEYTSFEPWETAIEQMTERVFLINQHNGWFDEKRSFGDDIALLHSEITEMYEAYRKDNWNTEKDSVQDEAADILIRLLDTCYRYGINLTQQFINKCEINAARGYKHGNKVV